MKTEPFVMLPRNLVRSQSWRSIGVNARRLIDFLLNEHMAHGGQENGRLLAPRRQLEAWGIGARHVSSAIAEAEQRGLIDVERGVGRRPSAYALTWLQLAGGKEPSRRWLVMEPLEDAVATSEGKSQEMTSEGKHLGYPKGSHKGRSDFRREVTNPHNKGIRREAPYKKDLTKAGATSKKEDCSTADVDAGDDVGLPAEPLIVDGWRVPDCWLAGPQFRPALSGVVDLVATRRAAAPGTITSTNTTDGMTVEVAADTTAAIDPDAWLKDEFYSLRRRAGWVAPS